MFVIRLPNGNLQVPGTAVHTGDGRIIGDVYVEIGPDDTDYVRLSERVIALRDGAVVYDGPPGQVDVTLLAG